jgi:branched-chain amino acid transport system substrate-binding protein
MIKRFKAKAFLLASLLLAEMLALSACGDYTATPPVGPLTSVASPATAGSSPILTAAGGSNPIVIYSSFPLTGSSQHDAETLVNAMKMALDDFTGGTGKIGNFTITYISLDDASALNGQWNTFEETNNANQAVANPDAMVYLGTYNSGAAAVSIPILNKVGMAMISPSNTYVGLTRAVTGATQANDPDRYYTANPHLRNYFRVVPADDVQGYAAVAFMASLNIKKVFQVDDSEAYGQGMVNIFTNACPSYGLECSQRASITGKEADYKSLANEIKAKNVDAIFFAGISQNKAGKLLSDIRAAGITIPFMGSDGIHDNIFIADAKTQAEGAYTLIQGLDETKLPPKGQDFLKRYRAKFGQEMAYTIYAYEAMSVALDAIKRAGVKDRARIVQALAATKDFEGAAGKWSFDKNGDTTLTDYSVYQVKDGKWNFVTESRPK